MNAYVSHFTTSIRGISTIVKLADYLLSWFKNTEVLMEELNNRKTPLDNQELEYFKSLLLEKRNAAEKELEAIDSNITNLNEADDADYSSVAHHMGDVGSDVEEQELNYQLKERTQKFIEEIDDALERIENGTYGICQATGKMISKGRLESVPHTRYSIAAKEEGLSETT